MTDWKNKVALVTGGSAGLGLAIAQALVDAGARVVIAGRNEARLTEAVARLRGASNKSPGSDSQEVDSEPGAHPVAPGESQEPDPGYRVIGVAADVTSDEQVQALTAETVRQFGKIDALFHTVGVSSRQQIEEVTPEEFARLLDLNFLTAVRCARAVLPQLREQKGHLVMIGSLSSKLATPLLGAYPASKFPMAAYAQQMRLSLRPSGVHVLLVCPGPIRRDDAGARYADQAESLPDGAGKPGGGVKLKAIDPDWLAEQILGACEKRRAELVVPRKARLAAAIGQLWPHWGDWLIKRSSSNRPDG